MHKMSTPHIASQPCQSCGLHFELDKLYVNSNVAALHVNAREHLDGFKPMKGRVMG